MENIFILRNEIIDIFCSYSEYCFNSQGRSYYEDVFKWIIWRSTSFNYCLSFDIWAVWVALQLAHKDEK